MKYTIVALVFFLAVASAVVMKPKPNQQPHAKLDVNCEICEYLVGQIENHLDNNQTLSEILTVLETDCDALKKAEWVRECQAAVETYGKDLVEYIIENETPELACTQVGLCNEAQVKQLKGAVECLSCQLITKQVEHYLIQNHTESDIINFIMHDCTVLADKNWVATCQGMVKEFGSEIIQMLANKEDPAVVCKQLKFCGTKIALPKDDPNCMLCEFAVGRIDTLLKNNQTETAIIDFLLHDCAALKEKDVITECKNLVLANGPQIIALLANEMAPSRVCTELKLCTSAATAFVGAFEAEALKH